MSDGHAVPALFTTPHLREQKDFLIPAQRTWYEETCFNASQLPQLDEVPKYVSFRCIYLSGAIAFAQALVLRALGESTIRKVHCTKNGVRMLR